MVRPIIGAAAGCALAALEACGGMVVSSEAASPPPAPVAAPGRGTFLIVHTADLADAAARWAGYRTSDGWNVMRLAVDASVDATATRRGIVAAIRSAAAGAGDDPTRLCVLLLGDAGPEGIPAFELVQPDPTLWSGHERSYATDHPYQVLADGADAPVVALGRIPARSAAEADALLEKVRHYEAAEAAGPWRRRVAYAAGEGRYGAADRLLETLFESMVARLVPDEFDVSVTYAKASSVYCPPPSRITDTVLERLGDGALLFNYVGHGNARSFDVLVWGTRVSPILTAPDLERLAAAPGRHPLALLTCCSAGWYDLPGGRRSMAEEMLFHPAGPVAVLAGSRSTHPYANLVLQKEFTTLLLVDHAPTAGALDLAAARAMLEVDAADAEIDALAAPAALLGRWPSSLETLRRMHVRLYNLLGDPALRLAHPGRFEELTLRGRTLTGRAEGLVRGRAIVTIETERTGPARSAAVLPVDGPDDPDLERKARINYAIANDPVLSRLEAPIAAGRLALELPGDLPAGAAVIKVYAQGDDGAGRPADAVGAVRVQPRTVP